MKIQSIYNSYVKYKMLLSILLGNTDNKYHAPICTYMHACMNMYIYIKSEISNVLFKFDNTYGSWVKSKLYI